MNGLPRRIIGSQDAADGWCRRWRQAAGRIEVLLLLAATETAAVEGISAAGSTAAARRSTAAADAELLLLGPGVALPHPLPPLPAGVSPALISHVVCTRLDLEPLVVDLGCATAPGVPHLRPPPPAASGPARCLSSGAAMPRSRVEALLALGRRWGRAGGTGDPLLVAECVPGGTTTAQALLSGLGIEAGGIVSGSLARPAHALKADLVARGLAAIPMPADPIAITAALGDPMQPLAAGLLLAAAETGRPVLLAGGSQMAAVLALALALAEPELRHRLVAQAAVGTTAWVARERDSDLALLLTRVGQRWAVDPLAFAASLHFHGPVQPALADYERGYVKEGVGAGGLAIVWELSGRPPEALAEACDRACLALLGPTSAPAACGLSSAPRPPGGGGLPSGDG